MPANTILQEVQKLHAVSERLDSLADEHPNVSEALITISGNIRHPPVGSGQPGETIRRPLQSSTSKLTSEWAFGQGRKGFPAGHAWRSTLASPPMTSRRSPSR
jgi:hypothetical protein